MAKYPQVAEFFVDQFGDPETSQVGPAQRKRLMEATDKTDATISRWISGDARPQSSTWAAIAGLCGMTVAGVAEAFRPTQRGAAVSLAQHVALAEKVDDLIEQVQALGAAVERLSRAKRRDVR